MKKCLFPLDTHVVSCPTCAKNLKWYLNCRSRAGGNGDALQWRKCQVHSQILSTFSKIYTHRFFRHWTKTVYSKQLILLLAPPYLTIVFTFKVSLNKLQLPLTKRRKHTNLQIEDSHKIRISIKYSTTKYFSSF